MKILLDECIPRKFKYSLPDHECHTVPEAGLAGKKNRYLLDLPEKAWIRVWNTSRTLLTGSRFWCFAASQIGLRISFHWCQTS
jgi:hypothetical protein